MIRNITIYFMDACDFENKGKVSQLHHASPSAIEQSSLFWNKFWIIQNHEVIRVWCGWI